MTFTNGCTLNGFWKEDIPVEGTYKFKDKTTFKGRFKNGFLSGEGKLTTANGDVYEGGWEDNKFHGRG